MSGRKKEPGDKSAMSITQLLSKSFRVLEFEGEWLRSLGKPELSGTWIVYGGSKNGKTAFALQLAKYLSNFAKVAYNSLEEGITESLKQAVTRTNFETTGATGVSILHKETVAELRKRLQKRKSARIVFIDSLQYTRMSYSDYIKFKEEFPDKLFIYISHAEGKLPAGNVAKKVQYDANIFIRVEGYRAFPVGRYGGGDSYTIWEQGANDYW